MKKVYKFNLIPGVKFVEKDGFYFAMADDPIWPKSHITKVVIEGLIEYEKNNRTLYRELTFAKKAVEDRDKTIEEKDKEIKTHKNTISYLNKHIEYIKKCAENEIDHRNKLLEENDKSIEYIRGKLHEEIMKSEAYKEYIKTFTDKINTLEATLKKKDETIEKLRNTAEVANDICDGYGALTDSLTNTINERDSEIKVLSDQVTRLMDQLKEVTGENSGCKSCMNGPEPCCDICGNTDCEHRVEKRREGIVKDAKSETNFGKALRNKFISALDTWLEENTKED